MIPKIIHYCWFGNTPKPKGVMKCIESWKRFCPDFVIKEWNETNFDVNSRLYTRQAYQASKWAFVSDVARLYALVKEGGVYLDTDFELINSLENFLYHDSFTGFEDSKWVATGIVGCHKNNHILREFLEEYNDICFLNFDGSFDLTTVVERYTDILLKHGLVQNGTKQNVDGCVVYPYQVFYPYDYIDGRMHMTNETVAIHWYSVSWIECTSIMKKMKQIYHRIIGRHRVI